MVHKDRFQEFREIQDRLSQHVVIEPLSVSPELIAAVDLHLGRGLTGVGAAVLCDRTGKELERSLVTADIDVPYVPGFLSFREMPICRDAISRLRGRPDVVLVDGQGIAHPRRFGLACHLGVELDLPTVGVAKSLLTGEHGDLGNQRGSTAPIVLEDEVVGMAVRTRPGVRPVFVSVGHRITLKQAVDVVIEQAKRFRLPEPSRLAHRVASDAARANRQ